ncbi:MAG TPA: FHA domain-containing protein [Anaerolineales bacterium]|nr:FHA domain-containing protein [Anaerolineales bacterium]
MSRLDQLESRLQSLIENELTGLLPGLKGEERIIQRLSSAIKQNIIEQKDRNAIAPNVFTLIVSTDTAPLWKEARVTETLRNIIAAAVKDVGLRLEAQPTITIATDDSYAPEDISVLASHKLEPVEDTQGMATNSNKDIQENNAIPENAFLIIEGVKVYPLKEPVINIGRRLENHLVIDDPRISRNHAQLRAIKGRFVLFDLNSTGGTFVNGQRTSQTVLYPGDVISLAGVALIFGQDNPPPRPDLADTSPLIKPDPEASERPTATLDKKMHERNTGNLHKQDHSDT